MFLQWRVSLAVLCFKSLPEFSITENSISRKSHQCGSGGSRLPLSGCAAGCKLTGGWWLSLAGSGLFTPEGPITYHYNSETEKGQLLIAELSAQPRLSPTYPPAVNWSLHATSIEKFPGGNDTFSGAVRRDEFTFSHLRHKGGNYTVCQGDLCCHLVYWMSNQSKDEVYVLGAFDGLHGSVIKYHWQVTEFIGVNVGCMCLHPSDPKELVQCYIT